jgi:hypothetical protein
VVGWNRECTRMAEKGRAGRRRQSGSGAAGPAARHRLAKHPSSGPGEAPAEPNMFPGTAPVRLTGRATLRGASGEGGAEERNRE